MKKIIAVLFVTFSLNSFGQSETKYEKIDSLLTYLASNNKFMGSIAIQESDKVVFEKNYGFADVKSKAKADASTRYKIGSITKMFTSVVIFQLVEEKKLTLDTKLSKFFPSIKNSENISIENLLEHSSGIYSFTNDADYNEYAKLPKTRAELMKKIKAGNPVFEPGESAAYSNSNFVLLGWIIEDLTKKTYAENIKSRIIQKAGLKNTGFASEIKNEAVSYHSNGKNWEQSDKEDMSIPGGAGAILSNASDLTKFIDALYSGKLISQPSLITMTTTEKGYGKGILTMPFGERKFFGHTGGIEDFTSTLGYYPKEKFAVALLDNGQAYGMNDIMIGVLSIYYKMPYRFPNLKTATIDVSILKKYEGTYGASNFPLKISIKEENGVLICQATGQESFPLNPLSETKFNFDPAGLELVFSENAMTILQGGQEFKLTKEK
jgi:CubicO group peptidase (beta-lactamase class C family)